jgi:CubicO group peptidase (beta-lactamase class C family)
MDIKTLHRDIVSAALKAALAAFVALALPSCGGGGGSNAPAPAPTPTPPPTPAGPKDITAIVESVRAQHGVPALAGAIVTATGLHSIGASGVRRLGVNTPVTADDKWSTGSTLKAVVSALAGISVDAGKIAWTTTVAQSFPELSATTLDAYRGATLEQLLSHTTGLPRDPPYSIWGATWPSAKDGRNAAAAWGLAQTPVATSGTVSYSNLGYMVAAAMIERAWGGDFEDLMRDRLFTPLALSSAGWGSAATLGGAEQPVGHIVENGAWSVCQPCGVSPVYTAPGGAYMSMSDWARLVRELMLADAGASTLISAASGRKLTTPQALVPGGSWQYALGWFVGTRDWAGGRVLTHAGAYIGFNTVVWVAPERSFAVLVASNAFDWYANVENPALDALASRLISYYLTGQ